MTAETKPGRPAPGRHTIFLVVSEGGSINMTVEVDTFGNSQVTTLTVIAPRGDQITAARLRQIPVAGWVRRHLATCRPGTLESTFCDGGGYVRSLLPSEPPGPRLSSVPEEEP